MNISVFGCGYVGLTTAIGLAELGNHVTGVDIDDQKIELLQQGIAPFFEPGLQELLMRQLSEKRLNFTNDARTAIEQSNVIFCAVGTPPLKDHYADLSAVLVVAKDFSLYSNNAKFFINKSTVPIGTSEEISRIISANGKGKFSHRIISNPEFLREGSALQDFFHPDRIIIGLAQDDKESRQLMENLYRPFTDRGVPMVFTDIRSSEVIKYASNCFLATRLSFVNELANFCELAGADIKEVTKGVGLDHRIGHLFFEAGIGFGGSCLPKDLHALIEIGKTHQFDFSILKAAEKVNQRQPYRIMQVLHQIYPNLKGKTIAVWGLSFKPGTDDLRDAPSLILLYALLQEKVNIKVYDPAAIPKIRKIFGTSLSYPRDYYSALKDSDALLLLTEWDEFHNPDYRKMKSLMRHYYILDGRNIFNPAEMAKHGFHYYGIGRKNSWLPAAGVSQPKTQKLQPSSLSSQRKLKSSRSRVKFGL